MIQDAPRDEARVNRSEPKQTGFDARKPSAEGGVQGELRLLPEATAGLFDAAAKDDDALQAGGPSLREVAFRVGIIAGPCLGSRFRRVT